ncbi:hypothetical protein BaRGS_00015874 [Batillaria attramentaria]|uniref:Uncharacterized protein n=1 Tax=Batillaria attramentaria TaxID=370345 RepID=A0ABD0L1J0_9CAEN
MEGDEEAQATSPTACLTGQRHRNQLQVLVGKKNCSSCDCLDRELVSLSFAGQGYRDTDDVDKTDTHTHTSVPSDTRSGNTVTFLYLHCLTTQKERTSSQHHPEQKLTDER